jgi:hypothetical protein
LQKYFTHFVFRDYGGFSCDFTDLIKTSDAFRKHVFESPYFKYTYSNYISTGDLADIKELAGELYNDSITNDFISNTIMPTYNSCLSDIFHSYYNWYNAATEMYEITWETKSLEDTIWTEIVEGEDLFNIVVSGQTSKNYRLTVIDNTNSIIEYDEVTVYRDSVLSVMFYASYQIDSTVYFTNITEPFGIQDEYVWDFGDGDSSNFRSPYHTFPAFDSVYYVCLTVTNACATDMYCDSIRVDSISLNGQFGKRNLNREKALKETMNDVAKSLAQSNQEEVYLSINYPNPFDNWSMVNYAINKDYREAMISIRSIDGREIRSKKLDSNQGIYMIDAGGMQSGLYTYSLIIDGVTYKTRKLSVKN